MNQKSTQDVPDVPPAFEKLVKADLDMPLKAEARRKPFGYATKQAVDDVVMGIKPIQAALEFLIESNLGNSEMRHVAKIEHNLSKVLEAAKTAQYNLSMTKQDEPTDSEEE